MEKCFINKKILVTGGGEGIGKSIVKKLVSCGANVVALSLVKEELKILKQELPQVTTITCDVTDSERVRELVTPHGPYHYLVNNAGVLEQQSFLHITEESFDRMFNVNVKAVIRASQVVAQMMIDNKIEGAIVNVSSRSSTFAMKKLSVYGASKAALDALSRTMALELGHYGIRVNCVNPRAVPTTFIGKKLYKDPEVAKSKIDTIPLHKLLETEDVVNAVLFLLSDFARMINGVNLQIDGGPMDR